MTAAITYEFPSVSKVTRVSARTRWALISEVWHGLLARPRSLSPWMFYDTEGSRLFERITLLPEYYLTRTERNIFRVYSNDIVRTAQNEEGQPLRFVELGAGTASKTGILLDQAVRLQGEVLYVPIDVSADSLRAARQGISGKLKHVRIRPLVANYVTEPLLLKPFEGTTVALYIGSSIGNFSPTEARSILRNLRSQLSPGDALLLGTDMVKEQKTLIAAYNDKQGVTAEFNLNILARLNRELDANFDLASFRHCGEWNSRESRMEMYLESLTDQTVQIPKAWVNVDFSTGERIHTENSYKFTCESICSLIEDAGFQTERTWTDEHAWFAVSLCRAG